MIICSYNSGDKIIPTLQHLALQKRLPGVSYELVLVDNNTPDDTVEKATNCWQSLDNPFPFRKVKEARPGLTYARQKGITEATFEYIVLCDDDNWLSNDYLQKVYQIFDAMPDVALVGGKGEPVFENDAPGWFYKVDGFGYALGAEGRKTGYTESVYGAGMGIRKSVFIQWASQLDTFFLTDRKGKELSSGGDTEICMIIKQAGKKIFFDETLTFKHFIEEKRLRWDYYLKLRKSFGVANAYLDLYKKNAGAVKSRNTFSFLRDFLGYYKYIISHFLFFLFPQLYKTPACANFIQTLSLKKTMLFMRMK